MTRQRNIQKLNDWYPPITNISQARRVNLWERNCKRVRVDKDNTEIVIKVLREMEDKGIVVNNELVFK